MPVVHGVHVWSLAAFPAPLTYWPAAQVVHAAHVAAFVPVLNVPAPQPAHTRSLAEVPALPTYWPAVQVFQGVH